MDFSNIVLQEFQYMEINFSSPTLVFQKIHMTKKKCHTNDYDLAGCFTTIRGGNTKGLTELPSSLPPQLSRSPNATNNTKHLYVHYDHNTVIKMFTGMYSYVAGHCHQSSSKGKLYVLEDPPKANRNDPVDGLSFRR